MASIVALEAGHVVQSVVERVAVHQALCVVLVLHKLSQLRQSDTRVEKTAIHNAQETLRDHQVRSAQMARVLEAMRREVARQDLRSFHLDRSLLA